MTRNDFVEKWRHEFGGMVLDAATRGSSGPELSIFVRGIMRQIDRKLAAAFDDLCAEAAPPLPVKPGKEAPQTLPLNKRAT